MFLLLNRSSFVIDPALVDFLEFRGHVLKMNSILTSTPTGLHSDIAVCTLALQGESRSSVNPWLGPCCVEFGCSPHVGFLQVLRFPLSPQTCFIG